MLLFGTYATAYDKHHVRMAIVGNERCYDLTAYISLTESQDITNILKSHVSTNEPRSLCRDQQGKRRSPRHGHDYGSDRPPFHTSSQ